MVWLPFFIFPYFPRNIGLLSSSQLTDSYFSEGWPSHQRDEKTTRKPRENQRSGGNDRGDDRGDFLVMGWNMMEHDGTPGKMARRFLIPRGTTRISWITRYYKLSLCYQSCFLFFSNRNFASDIIFYMSVLPVFSFGHWVGQSMNDKFQLWVDSPSRTHQEWSLEIAGGLGLAWERRVVFFF